MIYNTSTFSKLETSNMTDTMFLSQNGLGVSRHDHMKYPTMYKRHKKMKSLFWSPEEIDLSNDKFDFQKLPEYQQEIYTEVLSRAVLLDSVQGRSPAEALLPICTLPEMESQILTWCFFENIHAETYSHIIKNVYNNPSKVFDDITDSAEILECADSITDHYDKLIEFNSKRTLNVDYDEYQHKKALYMAFHSIQALEALRFYSAFAVMFAFGENELMIGSANELKLIARDESYHVGITSEVLKLMPNDDSDFIKIKEECHDEVHVLYNDVIKQELEWIDHIFRNGSLLGLNAEILKDYVLYLGYQKFRQFKLDVNKFDFKVVKQNPLRWINTWLDTANQQAAPQETEILNYQQGVVKLGNLDNIKIDL